MGMFDEIRVNVVLPEKTEVVDTWFQTKCLQNIMGRYTITQNGQLCEDIWDYEYIEDPDYFLGGYINKVEGSYRSICLDDYHGDIIFYDGNAEMTSGGYKVYRDYIARFTNGKLEKITYIDTEYPPNADIF